MYDNVIAFVVRKFRTMYYAVLNEGTFREIK